MSGFMARIFGSGQQATQPTQQQQPVVATNDPRNITPSMQMGATNQTAMNGVVPQGSADPVLAPLDKFKDIWQPATNPDGSPIVAQQESVGLDPQKLLEAANKADFTNAFDREKLALVMQGGEQAAQAMLDLLSQATKTAYGQSAVAANKILETRLQQERAQFAATIPELIRSQRASQDLIEANPAFAHPAVAPMVQMVQQQLQQKFPKATAAELQRMAKEQLQATAAAFNPQINVTPKAPSGAPDTDDFSAYVGGTEGRIF